MSFMRPRQEKGALARSARSMVISGSLCLPIHSIVKYSPLLANHGVLLPPMVATRLFNMGWVYLTEEVGRIAVIHYFHATYAPA